MNRLILALCLLVLGLNEQKALAQLTTHHDEVRSAQFEVALADAMALLRYQRQIGNSGLPSQLFEMLSAQESSDRSIHYIVKEWTHETLSLQTPQGPRQVDAINEPARTKITFSIAAWDQIWAQPLRRTVFVLHEFLPLIAHREHGRGDGPNPWPNPWNDEDYQLTGPLLEFLEREYSVERIEARVFSLGAAWLDGLVEREVDGSRLAIQEFERISQTKEGRRCSSRRFFRREEFCLMVMTQVQAAFAPQVVAQVEGDEDAAEDSRAGAQLSLGMISWGIETGQYRVRPWRRQQLIERLENLSQSFNRYAEQSQSHVARSTQLRQEWVDYLRSLPSSYIEQMEPSFNQMRESIDHSMEQLPDSGFKLAITQCRGRDTRLPACIFAILPEITRQQEARNLEMSQLFVRVKSELLVNLRQDLRNSLH